jgi:hypothetical protein
MATIITREIGATAKGSPLFDAEVDSNFINLNNDKAERTDTDFYVKNTSGVTIHKGAPVMATGTVGGSPQLSVALANLSTTPTKYMLGLADTEILANAWGYIKSNGTIVNMDTSAWAANTVLYFDPAVVGGLTPVRPDDGAVEVALVLIQGNGNGAVRVRMRILNIEEFYSTTSNSIAYFDGAKKLTSGSALTFNGTSLGIGTNTPNKWPISQAATINASSGYAGYEISVADTLVSGIIGTTSETRLFTRGVSNPLTFEISGLERARIDANGNLGLGAMPSSWNSTLRAFQISRSSIYSAGEDINIVSNAYYDSTDQPRYVDPYSYSSKYGMYNGSHKWYSTLSTQGAGNQITFTQTMTLDSSGNLGVGDTGPISLGPGTNGITVSGPTSGGFYMARYGGNNIGYLVAESDAISLNTFTGKVLKFGTEAVERARIDANGNIGIGLADPLTKLHIKGGMASGYNIVNYNLRISSDSVGSAAFGGVGTGIVLDSFTNNGGSRPIAAVASFLESGGSGAGSDYGGGIRFYVKPNEASAPEAKMAISSTGNLVIGSGDTSTNRVTIAGNAPAGGNYLVLDDAATAGRTGVKIRFQSNGVAHWSMGVPADVDAFVINGWGGSTNPEYLRIDYAGNLLIGKSVSASDGRLQVLGSQAYAGNFYASASFKSSDASAGKGVILGYNAADSTGIIAPAYADANGALAFWTYSSGWAERMRLSPAGYLGIGTIPTKNLDVVSGGFANIGVRTTASSGFASIRLQDPSDGAGANGTALHHMALAYTTDGAYAPDAGVLTSFGTNGLRLLSTNAPLKIYTGAASGVLRASFSDTLFEASSLEFRSFRYTNQPGPIGAQLNNAKNHFTQFTTGSANISSGWIAAAFGDTTGNRAIIGQHSSKAVIGAHDGDLASWADLNIVGSSIIFESSTYVERMRIHSGGSLLVGTQVPFSGNSNCFRPAGVSASDVAVFGQHLAADAQVRCIIANAPNYSGDGGYLYIGSRSTGGTFFVRTNGDVTNLNNSYGAISDIRLKENILDATPKLVQLKGVRVVNYNLIGDSKKQLGVIAQELEKIFPGLVEESTDYASDGQLLGTTTKSVKYSVFIPILIKALQEQQALIENLQSRVAALETT